MLLHRVQKVVVLVWIQVGSMGYPQTMDGPIISGNREDPHQYGI
jgi:hypothetical protein